MPRNGNVALLNMAVTEVRNVKSGISRVVLVSGQFTVTIEKSGKFPDDLNVHPDDTIDIGIGYDPRV